MIIKYNNSNKQSHSIGNLHCICCLICRSSKKLVHPVKYIRRTYVIVVRNNSISASNHCYKTYNSYLNPMHCAFLLRFLVLNNKITFPKTFNICIRILLLNNAHNIKCIKHLPVILAQRKLHKRYMSDFFNHILITAINSNHIPYINLRFLNISLLVNLQINLL